MLKCAIIGIYCNRDCVIILHILVSCVITIKETRMHCCEYTVLLSTYRFFFKFVELYTNLRERCLVNVYIYTMFVYLVSKKWVTNNWDH